MNGLDALQVLLKNHIPLVVVPFGFASGSDIQRVVAEGAICDKGFVFLDTGWNLPMAGTGSDHTVHGVIEGPFTTPLPEGVTEDWIDSFEQWWSVGQGLVIPILDSAFSDDARELLRAAEYNQEHATKKERLRALDVMERAQGVKISKKYRE